MCIDLSLMRSVRVDPKAATAEIGGGCLIGDVDDACKEHGLALPMGHVYHTGVAGMALNATSGVGYLARTRGLTVTYLREVPMVTADGKTRTVSDATDSDLFWATQGAGANFGVVTSMIFNLTKVPPKVLAGDVVKFPLGGYAVDTYRHCDGTSRADVGVTSAAGCVSPNYDFNHVKIIRHISG